MKKIQHAEKRLFCDELHIKEIFVPRKQDVKENVSDFVIPTRYLFKLILSIKGGEGPQRKSLKSQSYNCLDFNCNSEQSTALSLYDNPQPSTSGLSRLSVTKKAKNQCPICFKDFDIDILEVCLYYIYFC